MERWDGRHLKHTPLSNVCPMKSMKIHQIAVAGLSADAPRRHDRLSPRSLPIGKVASRSTIINSIWHRRPRRRGGSSVSLPPEDSARAQEVGDRLRCLGLALFQGIFRQAIASRTFRLKVRRLPRRAAVHDLQDGQPLAYLPLETRSATAGLLVPQPSVGRVLYADEASTHHPRPRQAPSHHARRRSIRGGRSTATWSRRSIPSARSSRLAATSP